MLALRCLVCDLTSLLGLSLLLLEELGLEEVGRNCIISGHKRVGETVSEAEVLAGLLVVVVDHLALE